MNAPVRIIKDTLSMPFTTVTPSEAEILKKNNVPLMKGRLFEVDDYGNLLFRKENTVVLGGAVTAMEHLFGVDANFKPATLNQIYNVNDSVRADTYTSYIKTFGVGIGGCALDFGNVYDPDFKQREILEMVPFRVSDTNVLEGPEAEKYFFRKQISTSPEKWAWYLKEFEKAVTIKSLWKDSPEPNKDGTEVVDEVYDNPSTIGIQTIGECMIKITAEDILPYFEFIGNVNMARYNSIGLFIGKKMVINEDYSDYVNVRLFSVVNIDNDSVKQRKDVTYLYRVYAAV